MDILVATIWTALALFLLYETSAVFSYLSLPFMRPLNFLTKVKEYDDFQKKGCTLSYSDYMAMAHGNFFEKLFSCRYCFGFWLALSASFAVDKPLWTPAVYFGGQLICSCFNKVNNWMVNHG